MSIAIDDRMSRTRNSTNDHQQFDGIPTGERERIFDELWHQHASGIHRMAHVRLNPQLRGRLDASDIVQETYLEANRTLEQFLGQSELPLKLWLRKLASQKIIQAHRVHCEAQVRSVKREQSLELAGPAIGSDAIAWQLSGEWTSPSEILQRKENRQRLHEALDRMEEIDREVLTLRHFEQLTSRETAEILGMSRDAIKKRYVRALEKLHRLLTDDQDDSRAAI